MLSVVVVLVLSIEMVHAADTEDGDDDDHDHDPPALVAAVIITGGWQNAATTAEVFLPGSLATCQLPALPRPRYQHSQDGALLCSGTTGAGFEAGVEMACVELTVEGIWATTHTLLMPRSQVGDT